MNFTRHKQLLFSSVFSKIRHKASANTPFQFCLDSVRQYDYENFLCTLLLKDNLRSCAFVLRAFNVEVSRVQEQVSEANIGLMRYQFWTDTLEKIYAKDTKNFPAHPVAQELNKVCRNFDVSKRNLSKLVNTRKNNISKKYFNNLDEIEKYAEDTVSPIYYLLLELAGLKDVHCDHAASHLGKAQGLVNMLRSVEQSAQQRFVVLPLDLLMKHNLSQENALRCVDSKIMRDVVFDVASRANQHLTKPDTNRWEVIASAAALNTHNPIRKIVDSLCVEPHPDKALIALSIGDPTILGNLKPATETLEAIAKSLKSFKFNGYAPSTGYQEAREAVAEYSCFKDDDGNECKVKADEIIICSGCSHALDLCITALANPGHNILVPRPGFSIYKTLADGSGIQVKYYNLLEDEQWKVDVEDLENKIDSKTSAIVIINPSNPCGSVYPVEHLQDILDVASRNHVPIIADEIYEHLVFPGHKYVPMGSLPSDVPILSCSGITKRFLVPGWRTGWIVIHDRNNILAASVKAGLINLSQRIIGSNTLVQGALPEILRNTPKKFFNDTINTIHSHAKLAYECLKRVEGLNPIMPEGAMYMMVGLNVDLFPRIKDDLQFVEQLMSEQSVFCLPGKCFNYPNFMRIVLTVPEEMLKEACARIAEFCDSHALMGNKILYKMLDCEESVIGLQ